METVSGEVEAGEARRTLSAIAFRQRGSILIFYILQLLLAVGGGILGFGFGWFVNTFLTHEQTMDPIFSMFAGIVLGSIFYLFWCRKFVVSRFRKSMAGRGLDTRFNQTLTLNADTIEMQSGAVHAIAPWAAVTEIFKAKGYWIFMVGMNAWVAPKRFFADEAAEMAFIRAALAHLSEAARNRSKDAVLFAHK